MERVLAGRYQLIKPLGTGGMSVVWLARDDVLDRHVAVKLLFAGFGRLRDEAKAAAGLSHPNVTTVFDYGEADGEPFVVMELINGRPLSARIRQGRIHWRQAAQIGAEVAAALNAAHARGLVHRDVTPSNIMLTATGVKVVDFGIATVIGAQPEGVVIGTRPYLAPERLAGEPGGPPADIYALGVVLREAIVGELQAPDKLPQIDGLPADVATIVARCLADRPEDRPDAAWLARRLAGLSGVPARAVDPDADVSASGPVAPPLTRVMPPGPFTENDTGEGRAGESRAGESRAHEGRFRESRFRGGRARGSDPERKAGAWRLAAAGIAVAVVVGILAGMALSRGPAGTAAAPPSPHSPSAALGNCSVRYKIQTVWNSGATISIAFTNAGPAPLHGWTLRFPLADGLNVNGGWNGGWSQQGSTVTVVGVAHNAEVAAGGSVSDVGTNVAGQGGDRIPRQFTLNGVRCRATED